MHGSSGSPYLPPTKAPPIAITELLCIAMMSWLVFSVVCALFGTIYHGHGTFVWLFVGIGCFISLAEIPRGRSLSISGFFCLFALIAATLVGLLAHDFALGQYWESRSLEVRTNVLPSEDAGAFRDAGEIIFADEARLDSSRALGYKDRSVFCVAPISDDSPAGGKVQFWATGVDCCAARGTFTCDDAWDPKAKAGIVLRNASRLNPQLRPQFVEAVKQAEAAFDMPSAQTPVFVRWVADPEQVETNLGRTGFGILAIASVVWLAAGWILALVVHEMRKGVVKGRDRA